MPNQHWLLPQAFSKSKGIQMIILKIVLSENKKCTSTTEWMTPIS